VITKPANAGGRNESMSAAHFMGLKFYFASDPALASHRTGLYVCRPHVKGLQKSLHHKLSMNQNKIV
jgi:hypothetical protein